MTNVDPSADPGLLTARDAAEAGVRPASAVGRLAGRLGADRAVGYTLLARAWSAASTPITLLLTTTLLDPTEQGFAFTFAGILALQVFFELGLGVVLAQFVSHEAGRLRWSADGRLVGDPVAKARLASLLRQAAAWYAAIAGLVTLVILPVGWVFCARSAAGVVLWQPAWVCSVAAATAGLVLTPATTLLGGAGQLGDVARVAARVGVCVTVLNWVMLAAGLGLLAAPAATLAGVGLTAGWVAAYRRRALADLWREPAGAVRPSWRREVWPFQWRVAVSWVSGYFIFQLFSPVAFRFFGPEAAGRVGLSLTLCNQVCNVALIWVSTKAPLFGSLIATRQYPALDATFRRAMRMSVGLAALGAVALVAGTAVLAWCGAPQAGRVLPPAVLALPAAAMVIQTAISGLAVFLRAHKQEPLLAVTLVTGVLGLLSTWLLARHVGLEAMLAGHLAVSLLIGLPWVVRVFRHKRAEWRLPPAAGPLDLAGGAGS